MSKVLFGLFDSRKRNQFTSSEAYYSASIMKNPSPVQKDEEQSYPCFCCSRHFYWYKVRVSLSPSNSHVSLSQYPDDSNEMVPTKAAKITVPLQTAASTKTTKGNGKNNEQSAPPWIISASADSFESNWDNDGTLIHVKFADILKSPELDPEVVQVMVQMLPPTGE